MEEEEEEEPKQSTVTLLEEEEEERTDEKTGSEADKNQWDNQTCCPFSSLSSLSLSCVATLPELLHRWCSARLAKERLRSLKKRKLSTQKHVHPDVKTPAVTHTAPQIPVPTRPQEALLVREKTLDLEGPVNGHSEGKPLGEVRTTDIHLSTHTPDAHTPELSILLEPSRTSTIPTHSFSDIHSSLMRPTPTHDDKLLPPIKDGAQDPVPTPSLPAASIPETQQASSATLSLSVSPAPQPLSSEMALPGVMVSPVKEQPVQSLPTASRPEGFVPPPTELPSTDTHMDTVKSVVDAGGSTQRQNVQAPQIHGEQGDPSSQLEDTGEEDLLSNNGNGNIQRTATDFYAELQNGGDYSGGATNGNEGAVHGSSQKESVFMRLNNRIKALEMNMSLSSRYLEELSQRLNSLC